MHYRQENGATTVKFTPLLATLLTVTTTSPVLAPIGTCTVITLLPQLTTVNGIVPTLTLPGVSPKLLPTIMNPIRTGPLGKVKARMCGLTRKFIASLDRPSTVTTTAAFPAETLNGTSATILVLLLLVRVAAAPLNVTVVENPARFVPVIVTESSADPEPGDIFVMVGLSGGVTVKDVPLVAWPFAVVTTMLPLRAPL